MNEVFNMKKKFFFSCNVESHRLCTTPFFNIYVEMIILSTVRFHSSFPLSEDENNSDNDFEYYSRGLY